MNMATMARAEAAVSAEEVRYDQWLSRLAVLAGMTIVQLDRDTDALEIFDAGYTPAEAATEIAAQLA
ncbi:hypothetical protein OVY01_20850 [Robbsia sp. Bb-Pol-6]|uniref:Uncharacterized protein n=1 Tax=Robbsia betulipollinis TaxID=2981849 RepID=A0ABT3ZSR0_9BURK|nr:hypothetical protein [Robbsia betulipollinis]MCY0389599.1 hypothetical protein [Robbsia betulipollinis]